MTELKSSIVWRQFLAAAELLAYLDCNMSDALELASSHSLSMEVDEHKALFACSTTARSLLRNAKAAVESAARNRLKRKYVAAAHAVATEACAFVIKSLDFAVEKAGTGSQAAKLSRTFAAKLRAAQSGLSSS